MDNPDGPNLPLPAMAITEESLFDVTAETVDANLIFLGLDNAGKTTLLQMLKNDRIVQQQPTLHPQAEEIIIGKIRFKAYDLAGHETSRRLWKEYFRTAGGILFMVDAQDRSRFPEAAEELQHLLAASALKPVPIAVFGMKVDLNGAASEEEFRSGMGLSAEMMAANTVKIFMCSVVERRGYSDAVRWLTEIILQNNINIPKAAPVAPVAVVAPTEDDDMMV